MIMGSKSSAMETEDKQEMAHSSTRTKTIQDMPPEILEHVFQKLNAKDMLTCRLVCRNWNTEIKAHIPQSLIVNGPSMIENPYSMYLPYLQRFLPKLSQRLMDHNNLITMATKEAPRLDFIHQINQIKSLHLIDLHEWLYSRLLEEHQQKQLQRLKVDGKLHNNFVQLFFQPCTNLKVLKLSDIALRSCDFEEGWNHVGNSSCLLPNLQVLNIYIDWDAFEKIRLYVIDGREVQLSSKSITFLLRHISSSQMKILRLELDYELAAVNSCIGRRPYRFEDLDLQSFICKNGVHLEELDLDIPLPMPGKLGLKSFQSHAVVPTSIKALRVRTFAGDAGDLHDEFDSNRIIRHPELLEHDASFYDDRYDYEENHLFWRTLYLAQNHLVSCDIVLDIKDSVMEIVHQLNQNNMNTLEKLSVFNIWMDSEINGMFFEGTKLLSLHFCSPLLTFGTGSDICKLTNMHLFPNTLTSFTLSNIQMARHEFASVISHLPNLTTFDYHFWFPDNFDLAQIENFDPIVQGLVEKCTTYLQLGGFSNFINESLQKMLKSFGSKYNENLLGSGFLKISNRINIDNAK